MAREVILKISLDDSWDEYDTINENLFIEDLFPEEHLKDGVNAIRVLNSPILRNLTAKTKHIKLLTAIP